jgi:hypothetical protein
VQVVSEDQMDRVPDELEEMGISHGFGISFGLGIGHRLRGSDPRRFAAGAIQQ